MDRFWRYKVDHLLFWIGTVLFHAFTRIDVIEQAGLFQFIIEVVVRNLLLAGLIYWNWFVLIPKFFGTRRFLSYGALLLLSLAAYAFAKNVHDVYLLGYVLGHAERQYFFYNTFYNLSIGLFYLAFSIGMYLSREWYFQKEHIRKIELEKLNTELEYLKAQINPHFLFNSINMIYFQIDKKNEEARETLHTFSEMLRYQLYECNGHEIAVEKEVTYLKNYVDLQRLRKEDHYKISFEAGDNLTNFAIMPLLLIPFVENAFKHVSHFTDKENKIGISLSHADRAFTLKVFNTRNGRTSKNGGIGLKNVKRRLELLYPERYRLDISETQETFEVQLQLQTWKSS